MSVVVLDIPQPAHCHDEFIKTMTSVQIAAKAPEENETAYCIKTNKYYISRSGQWIEFERL